MQIQIVSNFVRNMPWDSGWWTVVLARCFVAQGHSVRILVDGVESHATLKGLETQISRPGRTHLGANPQHFAARARAARAAADGALTLSLTGWVPGDLWLPLDLTPGERVRAIFRDLRPLSAVMEFVHHPWLIHEAFAHRRALQQAVNDGSDTVRFGNDSGAARGIGHASPHAADTRDQHAGEAQTLRKWLGIEDDELVFVLSAAEARPVSLGPITRGFAALSKGQGGLQRAKLVVLTRRQHSVSRLIHDTGCDDGVIVMGLSRRVELPLALADVAIAGPHTGGVASGRWISDAIRVGIPVVASEAASGAELAARGGAAIVRSHDARGWAQAFSQALDTAWRHVAAERARAVAPSLSVGAMVQRLLARVRSPNS